MKFYPLREAPILPYDIVFRESRLKPGLFFLIFVAISATMAFIGYQGGRDGDDFYLPSTLAYCIAGLIGILSLLVLLGLRASLRHTNWLIRYVGGRLLIKYRSYANYHLPEDDYVVVKVEIPEIEWIRAFREKRLIPGSDGGNQESWTYLDIRLNHSDTEEFRDHLMRERLHSPEKSGSKLLRLHYPVRLIGDDLIRIDWKSHQTSITPNIDKTLKILGNKIAVREREKEAAVVDFTSLEALNPEQQEQMIRQLAETGDTISASRLVQRLYGWNTTESVKYIGKLLAE